MKKLITTILITIFLINTSFSQIFDGIQISGDFNSTLEKFKSKGYIAEDTSVYGAILNFKNMEVYLFKTPKTNKVYKAVVYLSEKNNWADLKSEFIEYTTLFNNRYGGKTQESEYFKSPYYDGSGDEIKAVKNEKCKYWSYWASVKGANYYIGISRYSKIKIVYENNANLLLNSQEEPDLF
jgi:hypothetical protein